jgi:hypothetical protein
MTKLVEGVDYEVKDNFFDVNYFQQLVTAITNERDTLVDWHFNSHLNDNHTGKDTEFYFHHVIYLHEPWSRSYDLFRPLWELFEIKSLMRIKANCYPSKEKLVVHPPHTDFDFSHKGAIISLNTCDGGTVLEDGTMIDSVANRVLFFDPGRPHSSTTCTNDKARFNINVNWL